jgi:hypothetical protein
MHSHVMPMANVPMANVPLAAAASLGIRRHDGQGEQDQGDLRQ